MACRCLLACSPVFSSHITSLSCRPSIFPRGFRLPWRFCPGSFRVFNRKIDLLLTFCRQSSSNLDNLPGANAKSKNQVAMASSTSNLGHNKGWHNFSPEKKEGTMLPAAFLADDFETWMSSWTWKWSAERKKGVDRLLATQFPPGSRVARSNANSRLPTPPESLASTISGRRKYLAHSPPSLVSSYSSSSSSCPGTMAKSPDISFSTEFFEVKKSPRKGYGAFALKDIKEGTVISSEAPLFTSNFFDLFHELEKLTPEQRAQYRTLAAYMKLEPCSRDASIFMTNRFTVFGQVCGIFVKSSRFNHACHPYATCKYRYDIAENQMIITTCHDIKIGQEITICYTKQPSHLPENYGFYCDCPGCLSPAKAEAMAKFLSG